MSDDHPSKIELAVRGNNPVQVTGGDRAARTTVAHEELPPPVLAVDCTECVDSDAVAQRLFHAIDPDHALDDVYSPWWTIRDALGLQYETLLFENFSALAADAQQDIAEQFKSLYESTDAMLAATAADSGDLYTANSDLMGRVRTIDLDDSE